MAPVLTVPAVPMTQKGRRPALRSPTMAARSPSRSIRKSFPTGMRRNEALPSPRTSADFLAQPCVSSEPYSISRGRFPCSPSLRTSNPARACRATASPSRLAMLPPPTRMPLAPGIPISSASQARTWCSTRAGAWLKPARWALRKAASISAIAASGVPVPCTQPQKRGCRLPLG